MHVTDSVSNLEALELSTESIAQAFNGGLAKIGELRSVFKERFTSFIEAFTDTDDKIVDFKLPPSNKEALAEKIISNMGYITVKNTEIVVPQGLCVTYKYMFDNMVLASLHSTDLLIKVMRPYSEFLAVLVSNKDKIQSVHVHSFDFDTLNKKREAIKSKVDNCFDEGFEVKCKFGEVFLSANDFKGAVNSMKTAHADMLRVKQREIKKLVGVIKQHLKDIYDYLNKGYLDNISADTITTLSNGALCVANEVEFMSISYYHILTGVDGMEKTMDAIIDRYDDKK